MTLSRPSTTLSPNRSEPSWQRIVFLSPMCTQRPISIVRQLGRRLDLDALAEEHHAAGDDVRVGQLELQQPPVAHQIPRGVGRLAITHLSEARVRNLAWRGSRSREPRQRLCSGAPHIVVMAGKPTRALTTSSARYPHVDSTAQEQERTECSGDSIVLASTALITGCCWPVAGTPTPGSRRTRPTAGPRSTATPPTAATRRRRRRRRAAARVDAVGQGRPGRRRSRSGRGSYLAVNAQTPGGCSLMVWETDNKARQRWCTRLCAGRRPRPARCSTASTISTSASPAPCCRSRRPSGSGGASR